MKTEVLELEEILNQEIAAYSKLEKYILDKRDSLVRGDMEKLKNIDCEIEKFGSQAKDLEYKRTEITSKFGRDNLTLKEIIEKIGEDDHSQKISSQRAKLKNIAENIQRQNRINTKLIEHSLKIVEHSVVTIANFLVPEASSYNSLGKISKSKNKVRMSSVDHEV